MAAFYQFMHCPIQNNRAIDLPYANVRDAYRGKTPPTPTGKSEHNLVCLKPQYTFLVQRQPVTTCFIRSKTPEEGCPERLL